MALLAVMRDGLLRISEAAALRWCDVDFQPDGTALLTIASSKTDQEGEGAILYLGQAAADALRDIAICHRVADFDRPVFGLGPRQLARRIDAAARAAGLGAGFTGHSARVGMAQDLVAWGAELPALMVAGRWRSSRMPARYSERQLAARGWWPGITRLAVPDRVPCLLIVYIGNYLPLPLSCLPSLVPLGQEVPTNSFPPGRSYPLPPRLGTFPHHPASLQYVGIRPVP